MGPVLRDLAKHGRITAADAGSPLMLDAGIDVSLKEYEALIALRNEVLLWWEAHKSEYGHWDTHPTFVKAAHWAKNLELRAASNAIANGEVGDG